MRVNEALGRAIGGILAPLTGEGSLLRGARLFHPDGIVARADVRPCARDEAQTALGELARRLEGPALVRLSSAWWRRDKELPDVLGIAVRLSEREVFVEGASPRDQDLLFATFRHVATMPFAPLLTNVHDFFANEYYAVLPFDAPGIGRVKLRLVPPRVYLEGETRRERLASSVARGSASLRLEVKSARPFAPWQALAVIELREIMQADRPALGFSPFRAGRGLEPVGFFQMIRAATYAASQQARKLVSSL